MTRAAHMREMSLAALRGATVDQEFARACRKAGIAVTDALIGSPLLNLHIAQKKRVSEYERERWAKRKAARAT